MAEYDNTAADIKEIDSIDTESTSARLISPPGLSPFLPTRNNGITCFSYADDQLFTVH